MAEAGVPEPPMMRRSFVPTLRLLAGTSFWARIHPVYWKFIPLTNDEVSPR
jgi:hypothetical protein